MKTVRALLAVVGQSLRMMGAALAYGSGVLLVYWIAAIHLTADDEPAGQLLVGAAT